METMTIEELAERIRSLDGYAVEELRSYARVLFESPKWVDGNGHDAAYLIAQIILED
jgi:DNA-binding ferritin-like protein